jgi:hypothetical protein
MSGLRPGWVAPGVADPSAIEGSARAAFGVVRGAPLGPEAHTKLEEKRRGPGNSSPGLATPRAMRRRPAQAWQRAWGAAGSRPHARLVTNDL